MINITFQSEDEKTVQKGIESFSRYIESSSQVKIKGPCPSPLSKIQGNYRWQILFLSLKQIDGGGQIMKKTISKALTQFKSKHRFKNLKLFIDVDPISIL
jgi:primosomal protein N'